MNLILATDSYKISHWKQYPPRTQKVYSYFESRGGKYDKVLFFGLQYIIERYLQGNIIKKGDVDEAEIFCLAHFGTKDVFNRAGWEYILEKHNGRLPIEIRAIPEGSITPTRTVLFTVENTDPQLFWLTSYLETILEQVWYPCTIATSSYFMKQQIKSYLDYTGDDIPDFKLHDFGYRGSTSQESAGIGDAAHLINFKGTDTIAGIKTLQYYYGAKDMPAFSIPAAEHSTITAWGQKDEVEAFRNMLDQFPTGLVAVVSDSYDIFNACEKLWGEELREKVIHREGTLIVRPDSGDPLEVLPRVLTILGDKFGFTTTSKGYKVLPPYLRVIQGDGITEESLGKILFTLEKEGWSIDNIAFGSGGGLLQNCTRDTLRFAYKCSNVTIDGMDYPTSKNPITDTSKASKAGRFDNEELETIFVNGELVKEQRLDEIRALAV